MVAVIAYQSLNSNSCLEHGLAASTSQTHLRHAQETLAPLYTGHSGALKYPTTPKVEPHEAIQGPAELVSVADADAMNVKKPTQSLKRKRSDAEPEYAEALDRTLEMVKSKSLQIYQQAHRELSLSCDLIVFGELDSAHPEWNSLPDSAGKRLRAIGGMKTRACNCFSLHSSRQQNAPTVLAQGEGWCAARCNGVLTVFVHVPNRIAKQTANMEQFYQKIQTTLLTTQGGGVIDLVMGDTNQSRAEFSPEVISKGLGQAFRDADSDKAYTNPADSWVGSGAVIHKGTNSANNKKFDVAVYNTSTVKSIEVKYFTQFSFTANRAAAYTDHMGILVKVEKK